MGRHGIKIFDNRIKIDFEQMIIDFQEKTILTSLNLTLTLSLILLTLTLKVCTMWACIQNIHVVLLITGVLICVTAVISGICIVCVLYGSLQMV